MSKVFPTMLHVKKDARGRWVEMYDITPAEEYGIIQAPVFTKDDVDMEFKDGMKKAVKKFRNYTSKDYLLLIGDPIAIGLSCIAAARKSGGILQVLRWQPRQNQYEKLTIDINLESVKNGTRETDFNSGTDSGNDGGGLDERIAFVREHFGKPAKRFADKPTK